MNYSKMKLNLMVVLCMAIGVVSAQTPSDAVMMKPGEICFDFTYGHGSWNEYWEGDSLRENGNIGTMTMQSYTGGFMLGILDRVNFLAMVPYMKNSPSGGVIADVQGFQDISFFLKGLLYETTLGKGTFKTLASIGYSTPMSDYVPDAAYPIGLGCPDGIFRGILHYDADMGLYGRVDGAYHLRGSAFLQRTYYYSTQGYYSDEVDMPNAFDYNAVVGYITPNKKFQAEAAFMAVTTFDGFDIRRQDGMFPSNDIEATRVGINLDYYDLLTKGLALHVNTAYTLAGSNIGKATVFSVGASYQFPIWGNNTEAKSQNP